MSIVILGAGSAGLPVAIFAAQGNRTITLIEKNADIGGTLPVSAGQISAAGVVYQQLRGFEDSPDRHASEIVGFGQGKNDPALVALATEAAPAMIQWLESLGIEWDAASPAIMPAQEPYQTPRTYWTNGAGRAFLDVIRPVVERLEAEERLTIHRRTRARGLERTATGWQVASDAGSFAAETVVIATGGYVANRDRWTALHTRYPGVLARAQPHAEGDGLAIAEAVGGTVTHAESWVPAIGAIADADSEGWAGSAANLNPKTRPPAEIWVNGIGDRFAREDHPDKRSRELPVLDLPDQAFWVIFDRASVEGRPPLVPGWTADRYASEVDHGRVLWRGETIQNLAEAAGLPNLAATVAAYNEGVASGRDSLGREYLPRPIVVPPFYALRCHPSATVSYAGLAVDTTLNVLDGNGLPIPGLFAVGEVIGMGRIMGRASASGMALGPALALGGWLGRRLAS